MNLYYVESTAKEYHGCKDVHITWFMTSRRAAPLAPYAELIVEYGELDDEDRDQAEQWIDEMFTEEEARALLAWLNQHRPGPIHVIGEPQATPVKARAEGGGVFGSLYSIPLGGPQGCIVPNEADWDLPFKVNGYYDLRFFADCTPRW
jgi:hypothetical protein